MKKSIAALLGITIMLAIALSGCNKAHGGWIMYSYDKSDDGWTLKAKSADSSDTYDVDLNADNLSSFRVTSTSSEGKASLIITQGETEKTIDISGEFNENIDMGDFEPGTFSLRLSFEQAGNVNVAISWK